MRSFFTFALVFAASTALFAACGKGGGTGGSGSLCDPGENIFCRCPGGEAGTKQCKADGNSFEECVTREGPCPPIGGSTSSSSSSSSSAASSSSGGGTGGAAPGAYLDACGQDTDCESGKCRYGYCTKDCAKYDECELGTGECIQFMAEQICMPVCVSTTDCLDWYGSPSACGYVAAVDGTPVTTCSDWQDNLKVPPEGTNCAEDLECNLGNDGVQSVCSFGACTKGCFAQKDCPPNTTCSSTGSALGSCK